MRPVGVGAVALIVATTFVPMQATAAVPGPCGWAEIANGTCEANAWNGPNSTTIHAAQTGADSNGDEAKTAATALPPGWVLCNGKPRPPENGRPAICTADFELLQILAEPTLNDLRTFYPDRPSIAGEPAGWAVKGLPTNFTAPVSTHTRSGPLLGRTADVRFIPTRWVWSYGDGATATTTTGGATWEAEGQPRFTDTATSHVYRAKGDVEVTVSVVFSVEYRYNGGTWRSIDGVLTLDSPASPLKIVVGSTVLTEGACTSTSATC